MPHGVQSFLCLFIVANLKRNCLKVIAEMILILCHIFIVKSHDFLIFAPAFFDDLYFSKIVHLTNFVCGLIKRFLKSRSFSYADTANERHVAKNCLRTGQTIFWPVRVFFATWNKPPWACPLRETRDENPRFSTAEQNLPGVQVWKNTKFQSGLRRIRKSGIFQDSNMT